MFHLKTLQFKQNTATQLQMQTPTLFHCITTNKSKNKSHLLNNANPVPVSQQCCTDKKHNYTNQCGRCFTAAKQTPPAQHCCTASDELITTSEKIQLIDNANAK